MSVNKLIGCVYIDNQPFRVKSYMRSVTDDLVARFGSAEAGQTNLDLLKADTQKSFRGGMFQRKFDDPEMVSSITNAYHNRLDGNLYPTPAWPKALSALDIGPGAVDSWCWYKGLIYFTGQAANPPATGNCKLWSLDPVTGTITGVTLPAPVISANVPLELCSYGGYIFIAAMPYAGVGVTAYRFDGTSFVNVLGDNVAFMVFAGKLYALTYTNQLFLVTNHTAATVTYTAVSAVGNDSAPTSKQFHKACAYNNALYIALDNGLYRFDSVVVAPFQDYSDSPDARNFEFMDEYNGRLYYNIKNKLFESDGSNISEIYDFSAGFVITDIVGGLDRLWVGTITNTGASYTDKFVSGAPSYTHSAFCYNGIGMFEYRAFTEAVLLNYVPMTLIPIKGKVFGITADVYLNASLEPRSNGISKYTLDLSDEFTITNAGNGFVLTGSEMDMDYPAVSKVLNGIMLNYGGLTTGEGSFKLEAQYLINNAWSAFTEIWNTQNVLTTGISNDYMLFDQSTAAAPNLTTVPAQYSKLRFRLTLSITDTTPSTLPYASDLTMRYTLQPRQRRQWLLALYIEGVDNKGLNTPSLKSGTRETRTATALRKALYNAHKNKLPVLFYDVDFTEVKTKTTPLVLKGTDFIESGDAIAIQDSVGSGTKWLNRRVASVSHDYVNNQTSATVLNVGQRLGIGGSSTADYAVDTQVRKSHVVYIRQLDQERYLIDENTINAKSGASDVRSEIVVRFIEV